MPFIANRAFGWTPVEITEEWGMRALRQGMAYPLCNTMQCQTCGLLFLDIRFDDEEMARLYSGYRGEAYSQQRDAFEPGYAALASTIQDYTQDTARIEQFLAPHVKPAPRVLDWGGDRGEHTPFRQAASRCDVYDLSDEPLLPSVGRVKRETLTDAAYDLVVLCHVLEHTPDPEAVVRPAMATMAPDGVFYVEVPYEPLVAQAPGARDLAPRKRHWHEHVNFYTEEALRALLQRCGLEVTDFEARDFASPVPNLTRVLSAVCRRR
jgi:SAM-dependent methyltransferase